MAATAMTRRSIARNWLGGTRSLPGAWCGISTGIQLV